jgi:hypothetical protein
VAMNLSMQDFSWVNNMLSPNVTVSTGFFFPNHFLKASVGTTCRLLLWWDLQPGN